MNWWILALIALSTGCQDVAHTAGVAFVAHNRRPMATTAEGIEVVLMVASAGLAVDSLLQAGAMAFVIVLAVIFASAKGGAEIGLRLSDLLERRYKRPVRHHLRAEIVPHG